MGSLVGDEMLDAFAIVGGYDEVAWRLKERFGNLLDEVVFNMEVSSPTDEAALRGIIKVLQS